MTVGDWGRRVLFAMNDIRGSIDALTRVSEEAGAHRMKTVPERQERVPVP